MQRTPATRILQSGRLSTSAGAFDDRGGIA